MYAPRTAATAPANTSDEYRFVTGGRICMYILRAMPRTCKNAANAMNTVPNVRNAASREENI